jgi:hypothetical protein
MKTFLAAWLLAGMAAALPAVAISDAFARPDGTALGNGWQEVREISPSRARSFATRPADCRLIGPVRLRRRLAVGLREVRFDEQQLDPGARPVLRYARHASYYAFYRLGGGTSSADLRLRQRPGNSSSLREPFRNPSENVFFRAFGVRAGALSP